MFERIEVTIVGKAYTSRADSETDEQAMNRIAGAILKSEMHANNSGDVRLHLHIEDEHVAIHQPDAANTLESDSSAAISTVDDAYCGVHHQHTYNQERDHEFPTKQRVEQRLEGVALDGLANLYHAITGKTCERYIALGMATSAVSSLISERDALRDDAERLARMELRWKKAIEGLTPGGSEFVNDPEACAAHIRARTRFPKMIIGLRSERDNLLAEVNILRAEYRDMETAMLETASGLPAYNQLLANLCDRHKREQLPAPTATVCSMCEGEREQRTNSGALSCNQTRQP